MKKAADWSAIDGRLIPLAGRRGQVQQLVCALQARQSRLITAQSAKRRPEEFRQRCF